MALMRFNYTQGLQRVNIVKEIKKDLISILKKKNLKMLVKQLELTLDPNVYTNYITPGKNMLKDAN